jgi:hypothetical protein
MRMFKFHFWLDTMKSQYRSMMRYSGQYNLLIFAVAVIYFDHHLENRIRKDLGRVIQMQRTLQKIQADLEWKQKLLNK